MMKFLSVTKKMASDDESRESRLQILGAFDNLKNDLDDEVSE